MNENKRNMKVNKKTQEFAAKARAFVKQGRWRQKTTFNFKKNFYKKTLNWTVIF